MNQLKGPQVSEYIKPLHYSTKTLDDSKLRGFQSDRFISSTHGTGFIYDASKDSQFFENNGKTISQKVKPPKVVIDYAGNTLY